MKPVRRDADSSDRLRAATGRFHAPNASVETVGGDPLHEIAPRFCQLIGCFVGDDDMQINVAERIAHSNREAADEVGGEHPLVLAQNLAGLGDESLMGQRRRLPDPASE